MKNGRWTNEELEILKENYGTKTAKELSNILGRSKSAIQNKAHELQLEKDDKTFYNKQYFKEINTYDKAYWLGFIYADGYIVFNEKQRNYEIGMELNTRDIEHLKKFNKSLEGNIQVKERDRQPSPLLKSHGVFKTMKTCLIRLYSKEMVSDLINAGIEQNLSLIHI